MKSRWIRSVSALLAVICMTGCGMKYSEKQVLEETNTVSVSTDKAFDNATQTREAAPGKQQSGVQALNVDLFDGQHMRIWKGKGNVLLALKEDTLYLYDMASARVRAQTKTENWDMMDVYPYRDGYCAIGVIMKGNPGGGAVPDGEPVAIEVREEDVTCMGIFYDDSLNEKSRILLDELSENADVDVWSVSWDGAMLVYYDLWDGLNLYNLENRQKLNLLEQDGCPDLLSINAIFFEADDSRVVFTGQTDHNGSTAASWGRIGTDGTGFENYILQHDFGEAAGYGGGRLLLGEDSIPFQGGMGYVNTETGEAAYNTSIRSAPSVSGPFFSDDGTVFATAALDTNQVEVSVWRTDDFSLIGKEVIQDDCEGLFYRSPQICLFPELGACIVSMGGHNDIPQKTEVLNY